MSRQSNFALKQIGSDIYPPVEITLLIFFCFKIKNVFIVRYKIFISLKINKKSRFNLGVSIIII